jgi:hypothetical protein
MAKIKLTTALAGEAYAHKPGTVIEVSDAEAARHVANGNGVLVVVDGESPVVAETASLDAAPETADVATGAKKRARA